MRRILLIPLIFLVACGGGGGGGNNTPTPPPEPQPVAIDLVQVFSALNFEAPMAMLQAPGDPDNWYVVERAGRVWRFQAIDGVTNRTLYTDISSRVSTSGEGGLLGMAFHPIYDVNRRLFLSYTAPGVAPGSPLQTRLVELTAADDGLTADPVTEAAVLTVPQDQTNHNGGDIAFGPDGFLYFALGDGGGGNDPLERAQDTTNVLGAILALDIDAFQPYTWPTSNPFSGNPVCLDGFGVTDCPEIFAWGLRNPWRFSFDSLTGDLWLGDVGQSDWEEVDVIEVGNNYGWPIREGANCNPTLFPADDCDPTGLTDPVAEYEHDIGRSITGGYVYRGSAISGLAGDYVFGDFISGRIWHLVDDSGALALEELLDTDLSIVSFAEEDDGTLYVLDIGGGIYRIVDGN